MIKCLFLFLGLHLAALAQAASSICNAPKALKRVEKMVVPANFLTDERLNKIVGDRHIVIAGDTHFDTSTSSMQNLIKMFHKIKGPNSCVAFEFPSIKLSADAFVDHYVDGFKTEIGKINPADKEAVAWASGAVKEYENFQNYYKPLTNLAVALEMKNFGVDNPYLKMHYVSWGERNESIAENLTDLLKSGECTDVLMFIGKEHLSQVKENLKFYLLNSFKEYPFLSINLQMTRETIEEGRTWNTCRSPIVTNPVLFKSSLIESHIRIVPDKSEVTVLFEDFDYTLLLP